MKDLRSALRRVQGLPFAFPDDIELIAEAAKAPELVIRARFDTAVDAAGAEKFWREDLGRLINERLTLKLAAKWIYDLIELERSGTQLALRAQFTQGQAEQVLSLLASQSQKMLRKSPEEMERARRQREEAWLRRQRGESPANPLRDEPSNDDGPKPGANEATFPGR